MTPGLAQAQGPHALFARLSLRFASGDEEASFLAAHQQFLPQIGLAFNVLALAGISSQAVSVLAVEIRREGPANLFRVDSGDPRLLTLASWLGQCVLAALCAVAICCLEGGVRRFCSLGVFAKLSGDLDSANVASRSGQLVEGLLTTFSLALGAGCCLANRWHGPALMGADPEAVWGDDVSVVGGEELIVVMRLCCQLIAVGFFVPLRVSVMCVHHLLVPLLFAIVTSVGGSSHPSAASSVCLLLFFVSAMTFVGAYRTELLARERWKAHNRGEAQQAKVEETNSVEHTMWSALRIFCDAIFYVDDAFRIQGGCPELDEFLGCDCLSGEEGEIGLLQRLSEEGRIFFLQMVKRASKRGSPQMMPLNFCKKKGGMLRTEVFVMRTELADERRLLVGLRLTQQGPPGNDVDDNWSDSLPGDHWEHAFMSSVATTSLELRAVAADGGCAAAFAAAVARGAVAVIGAQGPLDSGSDDKTVDSWVPVGLPLSSSNGAENEASFVFDAMAIGLPILSCNETFMSLTAPTASADFSECDDQAKLKEGSLRDVVGLPLLDWVADGSRFEQWLSQGAPELGRSGSEFLSATMTLRPPLAWELGIELRVVARFTLCPAERLESLPLAHTDPKLPVLANLSRVRCRSLQSRTCQTLAL